MKNTNIYEEFIEMGREMCKRNARLADQTKGLITNLEKAHEEVMLKVNENFSVIKQESQRWVAKLNRLCPDSEVD